ncbi:vps9-ankyrin repeat-containing protein [Cordyceps javanica]|nr:vps9-ankyrin repeat-containing protein [Cordyceps javanica]
MPSRNEYTVGWICAINVEYVAATAFLDETHEQVEDIPREDDNVYVLGRLGHHNIVVASLPDGEYGTESSGRVARDLVRSFPNVKIGLMVGIGGGVPSKRHDIRLGDVVVSASSNGEPGVFQYDFGKLIQEGDFQYTRVLNQAPALLRNAVALVKCRYQRDGHQLQETINMILQRNPRLRKNYRKPPANTDRLYVREFVHPSHTNVACGESCGDDDSVLIPRAPREEDEDNPTIHYGLIASGNSLMKDAEARDRLAELKDVLCIEMEAAGLMNHYPCLIIRGICDYADSHKNKNWQGYAAMAAAAYAKDLLSGIPAHKVETVAPLRAMERSTILKWITQKDYGSAHTVHLARRTDGTGQWFLDSPVFKTWLENDR